MTHTPHADIARSSSSSAGRVARGLWRAVRETDLFIRIHFFLFSGMLPLLGAATVRSRLSGREIAGLIGIGLAYHIFAYVLNDVIDLPIDRGQPLRQGDPL